MRVYVTKICYGFEGEDYNWISHEDLSEVFVNEKDAKKYKADMDGKLLSETSHGGYLNYPDVTIDVEIEPRQLRTGALRLA